MDPGNRARIPEPPCPRPGFRSQSACAQTQEERALREPMTVPHAEDREDTAFTGLPLASGASARPPGLAGGEAWAVVPLQGGPGQGPLACARPPPPSGASRVRLGDCFSPHNKM